MGRQRQDRERGQENKSLFRGEVIDGKLMKLAEKGKQHTDSVERNYTNVRRNNTRQEKVKQQHWTGRQVEFNTWPSCSVPC